MSQPGKRRGGAEALQGRRQEACKAVQVPEEVLDLLADLRKHLQEQCEPPVYVSDRRLVKSLALLQASAGR